MPSRTTIIAIAAIIALPLLFAALGAGSDTGLVFGIVLVAVGLVWSFRGARGGGEEG